MNNNQNNEGEQIVTTTIALMTENDKPTLLEMLKRSGSLVDEMSTQQQLLDASFKAIKDSARFRSDLKTYMEAVSNPSEYSNYVDEGFFNVTDGAYKKEHGYTRVGGALRSIFSAENVSALAGAGIGLLATKLQSQANKGSEQRAIDYKVAEANSALAEAERLKAEGLKPASSTTGTPKWVLPVAIGGGVILLTVILVVALKKK